MGVGQTIDVDPSDGNVFAGGRLVATGPHTVGKLDVTTGKYTVIAQINSTDLPVLGASSTFDPDSRQLFVQFGIQASGQIENFAINVDTKNVTLIPEDPEEGRIITTMAVSHLQLHAYATTTTTTTRRRRLSPIARFRQ